MHVLLVRLIMRSKVDLKEVITMLTKRIIPCLDIKNGKVVKGINFVELKDVGDPIELS